MKWTKDGRIIKRDDKEVFIVTRYVNENNCSNMTPCETDAMTYFILDALNNGNFDKFYQEYMAK